MSNETNNNNTEADIVEALPIKIESRVRLVTPVKNLVAFASITINDSFVVDGLKVLTGEKGLFVNMPSAPDGKGGYKDVCFPITADLRQQISDAVLNGYENAIQKLHETLEAAESIRGGTQDRAESPSERAERPSERAERPPARDSVIGQINDGKRAAQEHTAPPSPNRPLSHAAGER